jgi:hypothetical protein
MTSAVSVRFDLVPTRGNWHPSSDIPVVPGAFGCWTPPARDSSPSIYWQRGRPVHPRTQKRALELCGLDSSQDLVDPDLARLASFLRRRARDVSALMAGKDQRVKNLLVLGIERAVDENVLSVRTACHCEQENQIGAALNEDGTPLGATPSRVLSMRRQSNGGPRPKKNRPPDVGTMWEQNRPNTP